MQTACSRTTPTFAPSSNFPKKSNFIGLNFRVPPSSCSELLSVLRKLEIINIIMNQRYAEDLLLHLQYGRLSDNVHSSFSSALVSTTPPEKGLSLHSSSHWTGQKKPNPLVGRHLNAPWRLSGAVR